MAKVVVNLSEVKAYLLNKSLNCVPCLVGVYRSRQRSAAWFRCYALNTATVGALSG